MGYPSPHIEKQENQRRQEYLNKINKCTCGAEKVYGLDNKQHSSWCDLNKEEIPKPPKSHYNNKK